jgi:hypothetical protein
MTRTLAPFALAVLLAGCASTSFPKAWLEANCERTRPCLMHCPDGSVAPSGGATCVRTPATR